MKDFNPLNLSLEELLLLCKEKHGHLCAGQVLGARLSLLGLELINIKDPYGKDRKKFLVYVEIDRCATDAIQTVTGVSLGKRTMKFLDYGIMAATFLNLETKEAYRIVVKEEAKKKAKEYLPQIENASQRELMAYKVMPLEELFDVRKVRVLLDELDLPGKPRKKIVCSKCGIVVRDGKEIWIDGEPYCKICAGGGYFIIPEANP
ncbi:MAG: FmdE family protein [Thermodesulfobacteriaceae bacterium]|nr:FmdE family protein [Thermodesulfobacteriaceae bacterium]